MYKIIALASIPGLEQELNKWFAQGYAPVGGLVVSDGYYLQAIMNQVTNEAMGIKSVEKKEIPNVSQHTSVGRVVDGAGATKTDGKASATHAGNTKPHISSPKFTFSQ